MTSDKETKTLTSPSFNNSEIPELDMATANQLLNNVFAACERQPNTIPVEVLESWGNYKRPRFHTGKTIAYSILVILILLPLMFFRPGISAARTNVDSSVNALYDVRIHTLLPLRAVSATLDGSPVNISRTDSKRYTVELTRNGTLTINAVLFNGQSATKTCKVAHLDTDKPIFKDFYSENGQIYLSVIDTYSGIDYDNISGLEPISYDDKEGLIVFNMPSVSVTVTIPDKAGNELTLLLSPIDHSK